MAKLTKDEAAARCGMPSKSLSVYILRNKLTVLPSGEIDDRDPKNAAFIEKYARKAQAKAAISKKETSLVVSGAESGISHASTTQDQASLFWENPEFRKIQLQNEKLEQEISKLKLGNEKVVGNFIQIEPVKFLLTSLADAINIAWDAEIEDVLNRIGTKYDLSREEKADLRKEKTITGNLARERALKEAKKMLRQYQQEASNARGVGEHD